jgi:RNA polymerase sigma-70 factor, ECF subfamily
MSIALPELADAPRPRSYAAWRVPDGATRTGNEEWLDALRGPGSARDTAVSRLHGLLLRGARVELRRRQVPPEEMDDLATQAANDALVAILAKLDTFRGASRFTTWAYKFVVLEAGVKARRRAWHGREVPLGDEAWQVLADPGPSVQRTLEETELLRAIRDAVDAELTDRQREVFCALALNGVPIDVLAERLGTTRGALYKMLHDARRKLRAALDDEGGEP